LNDIISSIFLTSSLVDESAIVLSNEFVSVDVDITCIDNLC